MVPSAILKLRENKLERFMRGEAYYAQIAEDLYLNMIRVTDDNASRMAAFTKLESINSGVGSVAFRINNHNDLERYVVFASYSRINPQTFDPRQSADANAVEMYVSCSTPSDAKFTVHMGIQRVKNDKPPHEGLSTLLHGFAAKVMQYREKNQGKPKKSLMINRPVQIMSWIIINKFLNEECKTTKDTVWRDDDSLSNRDIKIIRQEITAAPELALHSGKATNFLSATADDAKTMLLADDALYTLVVRALIQQMKAQKRKVPLDELVRLMFCKYNHDNPAIDLHKREPEKSVIKDFRGNIIQTVKEGDAANKLFDEVMNSSYSGEFFANIDALASLVTAEIQHVVYAPSQVHSLSIVSAASNLLLSSKRNRRSHSYHRSNSCSA
jgi:hypothetical protein